VILVDSNIILDIVTNDSTWIDWSLKTLQKYSEHSKLAINPIIYAEVSIGFEKIEDLEKALPIEFFERLPLSVESLFLAGKCFLKYKQNKGSKLSVLPDFFIGAQAAVLKIPLMTRDTARYTTYFPTIQLIAPASRIEV